MTLDVLLSPKSHIFVLTQRNSIFSCYLWEHASHILHCVSNAKEDSPYCHIFGTSLPTAPKVQKVPAQVHYNVRSLSWMGTWNSTWAEVTYSKTPTYIMQYLCCACDLENNDIWLCEELTWNHECFLLFLDYSVSEKMGIISIEEQDACYHHEHTELYRWSFWWHLQKLGAKVPYPAPCLDLTIKEPVKAARSLEIGNWRWWMADLWITFQYF